MGLPEGVVGGALKTTARRGWKKKHNVKRVEGGGEGEREKRRKTQREKWTVMEKEEEEENDGKKRGRVYFCVCVPKIFRGGREK